MLPAKVGSVQSGRIVGRYWGTVSGERHGQLELSFFQMCD
jgi:hypothetical protein